MCQKRTAKEISTQIVREGGGGGLSFRTFLLQGGLTRLLPRGAALALKGHAGVMQKEKGLAARSGGEKEGTEKGLIH